MDLLLSRLQEAHRAEAVRVSRGVLRRCPGLEMDAEDVVQEVNLRYLLALKAGDVRRLERAFGARLAGGGAPTRYYWESVRNEARHRVAAARSRRKHECAAACQPSARAARAECHPLHPRELARVPEPLAEAYAWAQAHSCDWTTVALIVACTETEVLRRVAWAVAHRDDRLLALPRDAGVEPGWLQGQVGKARAVALCLLEGSAWPATLWMSETGLSWGALRRARQRARLRWPVHWRAAQDSARAPDSCRRNASATVEGIGGRDPSARS